MDNIAPTLDCYWKDDVHDMAAQLAEFDKKHEAGEPGALQERADFVATRKARVMYIFEVCLAFLLQTSGVLIIGTFIRAQFPSWRGSPRSH